MNLKEINTKQSTSHVKLLIRLERVLQDCNITTNNDNLLLQKIRS